MRIISVLFLVYLFFPCFAQGELIRLGTLEEINVSEKATNSRPLLVVQNIVYSIPDDCFCNRDADKDISQRDSGKDDSGRNQDNQTANRASDSDESDRNASGQQAGRNLGTDFIYREENSSGEGRDNGNDDADRDAGIANSDRNAGGDSDGRNAGSDAKNRNAGNAAKGRSAGNAANGRDANSDNLARNFATVHTIPSCLKAKDSCTIEVLGFHPKARIEYFDKIESIKAVEMVIKF